MRISCSGILSDQSTHAKESLSAAAMEKRIELERRGKNPEDIRELNLDNCRSTTIVGLTDEFSNLESLSLINVGLTSLKGFPKLPNLKKLELSDNRIINGLNLLCTSPKLTSLNLSGNKIKDLDTLEPLKEFKHLKNLDLFNNEATSIDNYRDKIFKMIPNLKFLDGYDAEDCEAEASEFDESEDEVNGNDDDTDEDGTSEDEEDVGLGAVYQENLDDLTDEEDYEAGEEEEEDEDAIEEEEEEDADSPSKAHIRGKKRKHEDGESAENN